MLASDRESERRDDDRRDRLVVHRARVLGRVARFDHQRGEDVGSHHGHADREDHEPDGRRREGRQRDPGRDAAAHQALDRRARPGSRRHGRWRRSAAARRRRRACRAVGRRGRRWCGRGSPRRRRHRWRRGAGRATGRGHRRRGSSEKAELDAGQVDRPAGLADLVAVGVEDEIGVPDDRLRAGERGGRCNRGDAVSPASRAAGSTSRGGRAPPARTAWAGSRRRRPRDRRSGRWSCRARTG